ncbi:hypothetical protein BDQ17DRAFT_1392526 [Cyathus striatus]|nr:hypothetical protein BDQ17DRAFT_1392526 [Cyathus striatus]
MLQKSNLKGFDIPGHPKKLITSLFTDDTSVYLSAEDNPNELFTILNEWCAASGAKFNVSKMEILPIGNATHQQLINNERKQNPAHEAISPTIKIAKDGEPIHALGAFIRNKINNTEIWTPTMEKCEDLFEKWARTNPTLEGQCQLIQLVAGGETQYKTRVEQHLQKMIVNFLWDNSPSLVAKSIMREPHEHGGKKLLDIEIRNEAIEVMKLQHYLDLSENRPRWAYLADNLIAREIPKDSLLKNRKIAVNCFLQNWLPKQTKTNLPGNLRKMLKVA